MLGTITLLVSCFVQVAGTSLISADQIVQFKVGTWVVQKTPRLSLNDEGRTVELGRELLTYKVEKVEGDRVRLSANGHHGWVLKSEVVPSSRAISFFSDQIKKQPEGPVRSSDAEQVASRPSGQGGCQD